MNCPKCCQPILLGPGGCACTVAARHKRETEEAVKRGEKLAEMISRAEKAKREIPKVPQNVNFETQALDEFISQVCDFHVDLIQEAIAVAKKLGAKKVTREHVEKALKKLRRDL